jgi:SAM-dependent methyltransferase
VPDNPYCEIPYLTYPMAQTHPDRLASVATLYGMTPAPVDGCRVLEVGCGDGGNLIPMAYSLPDSSFLGIDTAAEAIAAGQQAIAELGLRNVELLATDLRELDGQGAAFDYIVAHGLYSWVPIEVREALLYLCSERLAPQGVAFISYNALPGRHVRLMLREMMLYHTRNSGGAGERIDQARAFLQLLAKSRMVSRSWQPMVDDEIERLLAGNPGWLFHDDLAAVNESFYFRDFAAAAARHRLQYLGEAEEHLMFDPRGALAGLAGDVIEREQYLDFLYFRRLRQTLLCRDDVALQRTIGPERMDGFLFSSPARPIDGQGGSQIEGLNSVRITAAHDMVATVVAAMGEVYPLPVPFDELLAYARGREALCEILFTLVSSGFAEFHVYDFPCESSVSARPRATRLARWQAERSKPLVCSGHGVVQLDDAGRRLLLLLDGTRDFESLVSALSLSEEAVSQEQIRELLPQRLAWLAGKGLLEA